jgi:uncharacterized protein
MMELPLFSLNTVLFPGMPINLHIFEERYKLMINTCIENRQPFGVVLIANGVEVDGPLAEPHLVGCTARITQVQPLSQGRMNIAAVGRERFQILSLNHNNPYLVGVVESYPMPEDDPEIAYHLAARLRSWIDRYLKLLELAGQAQVDTSQLPHDPLALAYLAAMLVQQISPAQKQELLAAENTNGLLRQLVAIYRREVTVINATLSPPGDNDYQGLYSLN